MTNQRRKRRVRVQKEQTCPLCRESLASEEHGETLAVCAECETLYHDGCVLEMVDGACSTLGCKNSNLRASNTQVTKEEAGIGTTDGDALAGERPTKVQKFLLVITSLNVALLSFVLMELGTLAFLHMSGIRSKTAVALALCAVLAACISLAIGGWFYRLPWARRRLTKQRSEQP